jgi:hypothetical protein
MSTNRKIVVIATLATYLPELNLSGVRAPAGAFASAQPGRVHVDRFQAIAPTGGRDFQLQGRGLGE